MAGGEPLAAETVGELEHRVEPDVAVAADAWVRRLPSRVPGDERLDHALTELLPQVDCEVRQTHTVGECARLRYSRGRAAAALGVVLLIGPQLKRHRDGLPLLGTSERGHRTVDAAAHRHQRPPRRRRLERCAAPRRASERSGECVRGQLRGVELAGAEAAELGSDLARPYPRRLEDHGAAHERHGGAGGGERRAAALRVEAGVGDASAVDGHREPDLIAAGATGGGDAEGPLGLVALALRRGEMVLEGDAVHAAEDRPASCPPAPLRRAAGSRSDR